MQRHPIQIGFITQWPSIAHRGALASGMAGPWPAGLPFLCPCPLSPLLCVHWFQVPCCRLLHSLFALLHRHCSSLLFLEHSKCDPCLTTLHLLLFFPEPFPRRYPHGSLHHFIHVKCHLVREVCPDYII